MNIKNIINLSKIEFKTKYSNSFLGYGWHLILPILNYAIILMVIKNIIYQGREDIIYFKILVSLIVWNTFREVTLQSCSHFLFRWSIVKEVKVSLFSTLLSNHLSLYYSLIIQLIIFYAVSAFYVSYELNYFVMLTSLLSFLVFTTALSYLLAILGTFYYDIFHIWNVLGTLMFWSLPILYGPEQIPEKYRMILETSPLFKVFYHLKSGLTGGGSSYSSLMIITLSILSIFLIDKWMKHNKNKLISII